jgi:hypothetical protein
MDLREAIKQIDAHLKWAGKDTIVERQIDLREVLDWLKELKALRRLCELEKEVESKPDPAAFTTDEREHIALGLAMRRNMIETGDPTLSSADAAKMDKEKVRALSPEQMRTILEVRDLEHKIWNME